MATVTRQNIGLQHDKISVLITTNDYLPNFDKALKDQSKNANMPGFRKGMVPTGLVKKMYGQALFNDIVLKDIEKGLIDYLQSEKLDIFAQPIASDDNDMSKIDCNNPADYTFSFEIGLRPTLAVTDLSSAKLTEYKITVTDEMVATEVERLQQKFGKIVDCDVVDKLNNNLTVTLTESNENGAVAEDAVEKTNSFVVKYFTQKYQTELMGKKVNDTVTFALNQAFNDKELAFTLQDMKLTEADASKHFVMKITKINYTELSAMDEAFYAAAFPNGNVTTEDGVKEALKAEIENYWAVQTKNKLQDDIYHYLVNNNTVTLPETFLKKWMQTGREKPSTTEEVELEFPQFAKSLQWTLISDTLCKEQNIKADQDDIKDFARKQLMGYMGINELNETHTWVEDYATKMLSDKKFVEDTYHRVVTEKLFDWAITKVSTTIQAVSVDEFTAMAKENKE